MWLHGVRMRKASFGNGDRGGMHDGQHAWLGMTVGALCSELAHRRGRSARSSPGRSRPGRHRGSGRVSLRCPEVTSRGAGLAVTGADRAAVTECRVGSIAVLKRDRTVWALGPK